jgi:cob(I)alamin adenosyltransferase
MRDNGASESTLAKVQWDLEKVSRALAIAEREQAAIDAYVEQLRAKVKVLRETFDTLNREITPAWAERNGSQQEAD